VSRHQDDSLSRHAIYGLAQHRLVLRIVGTEAQVDEVHAVAHRPIDGLHERRN
jgi:hypothetical protein